MGDWQTRWRFDETQAEMLVESAGESQYSIRYSGSPGGRFDYTQDYFMYVDTAEPDKVATRGWSGIFTDDLSPEWIAIADGGAELERVLCVVSHVDDTLPESIR
ncbi:MAG: hypothetical protein GF418_06590 [Chitinivibrionales bacterium]|nr:hypothetical protein [Chitinivibrionales bacterium]MBD3395278.1 hypothetical protein [Chitinivibrionales bacterium]